MPPPTSPKAAPEEHLVRDFDEARALLARLYGPARADLRPSAAGPFSWRVRLLPLGSTTLVLGDLGAEMTLQAAEGTRFVLGMARRGHYEVRSNAGDLVAASGESAFMATPGTDLRVRAPEGLETFNLSIEPSALLAHLHALTGAAGHTALRFAPHVALHHGAGAEISKLANLLREAGERPDGPLASPHVLGHLREALYGAILAGLDSTASQLFQKPPPAAGRRTVKLVEEHILAHISEPVSVAALAALTGVGIRSLERSFKAVHGCSIRAFLKTHRLELARRCLLAGEPGMTVTQVLHASGFGHPGEFSAAYRRRFGEAPSATLYRSRSQPEPSRSVLPVPGRRGVMAGPRTPAQSPLPGGGVFSRES